VYIQREKTPIKSRKMKMKNARDFQVIGKYLENTQRVFTAYEILHIKRAIGRGVTIKRLSQHYNVDYRVISQIFKEFMWSTQDTILVASPKRLGYKDEPYYETESEMLNEVDYTWESLSESEREWYLQRIGDPNRVEY
jgi:hypothetical protein